MWLIILLILLGVLFLVAELVLLPGVSLGVYIDQRSTVEVVGFENFNVVVRKVADEPSV